LSGFWIHPWRYIFSNLQWIFPKTRFKGLSYRSNTATIYRPTVDGWALISTCFLKYGVIHAYSRKLRLCPFIARPPMDGHISGTMRKPVKFSFQFIARLPMDGHISGTMRKPVKFSFQNIRQN